MKKNRIVYIVLCLILLLMATGAMFIADQIQQCFLGTVKITEGVIETEYGDLACSFCMAIRTTTRPAQPTQSSFPGAAP